MKDEAKAVRLACPLIFVDHSPIRVQCADIGILATDKRETNGSSIIRCWRRDRATNAATIAVCIGESVPVHLPRFQATDQHSTSPVRLRRDGYGLRCDHALKLRILRNLDGKPLGRRWNWMPSSPQQHAVAVRIAGSDSLRKELAALTPMHGRSFRKRHAPCCGRAE